MNIKICLYLLLLCISFSCASKVGITNPNEDTDSIDCDKLVTALLELDENSLASLLNQELENFTLLDQDNNTCLHDNNLKGFRDLLNNNCSKLSASVICCGCIETFPTISEISVEVDSFNIKVIRVLDLRTPDEQGMPMRFDGVHI